MVQLSEMILMRRPWLTHPGLFSFGFTKAGKPACVAADDEVADRLITAYRQALRDGPGIPRPDDIWTNITDRYQGDLARILTAGSSRELLNHLRELPRRAAGHGFLQGEAAFNALAGNREMQGERALWLMDHLVGMAEAVGALSVRCPEQGDFAAVPQRATASELRSEIERRLGTMISLPPLFDGLFALEPDTGALHLRSIMSAYSVWKAATLARHFIERDHRKLRLAEIGAGVGFSALAAHRLGVASYSIYDIPAVNVVQGYFLLKCLPSGAVSLYGEPADSDVAATGSHVHILPAFAFHDAPVDAFDVTVNMDSLPEISRCEAMRYINRLPSVSKLFLSINQEAEAPQTAESRQLVVREMVAEAGAFKDLLRYANWVRQGYVDELWCRA